MGTVAASVVLATPVLLAEADPISGGAGWIGAGLLGAVLAWLLLKHLPAKDDQIERLFRAKDAAVKEVADIAQAVNREMRADFQLAIQKVIEHCERENKRTADLVAESYDRLVEAIDELRVFLGVKPPLATGMPKQFRTADQNSDQKPRQES